ncbi:MAG: hypothetical protein COA62_14825 [Rhodobiaceae bacterium]|nr:MAG: hypothetical protein COA62_14825 [Rhodobiaceae bacterium]
MKILSRMIAVGAMFGLAACGTWHAESYLSEEISGNDFNACLAREYQDRATSEAYVDCNWVDTARIVERGRAAASGQTVMPFDPANHAVLPEALGELQEARALLMDALDNGGRDGDRACQCAKAQRYYDGWVEQASDNDLGVDGSFFGGVGGPVQPGRVEAEKAAFYEALAECGDRVGPWTIYFGFNKSNLTAAAQSVVDEIANTVGSRSVSVIGHTDTSGSSAYNSGLGQRRANSVSSALQARGAGVSSSATSGESSLAVSTGDGVREPLNRRAVVSVD